MNKAKTLKGRLGFPNPFLSVAWDTDDIPSQASANPNLKWKDINWKKVEKYVFKLQKLIYRASSQRIWRWATRRHPNKSSTWVKKKYFPSIKGTRN
ncbi:MAG: hypothetical protein F6K54_23835 [Okeania sp. SIO3B5]|uniref:reverse transcriptase N-terminal domain-containing protein n=1 Tax=Okeania sp. SIO3B5 TaxID=2607811 RepID=UPI001400EFB6|nr:reverse transcriptase N-terminal domain-containing protein [Okeania sp. SIO3B5]NEO55832.1 hypothetical protein [Okeania sp. SIO3B5]